MYSHILLIALCLLGFGLYHRRHRNDFFYDPFLTGFFHIVFWGFVSFVANSLMLNQFPQQTVAYKYRLAAMRTTDSLKGTFVLGSGSVQSNSMYQVYVVNDDNSLTPVHIPANSLVRIIEDASLKDVGFWTQSVTKRDYSQGQTNWLLSRSTTETIIREELRVPVGTVVHTFSAQ